MGRNSMENLMDGERRLRSRVNLPYCTILYLTLYQLSYLPLVMERIGFEPMTF
jgi:hypothetical protein